MQTTSLYQIYDLKAEAIAGPIMMERKEGPAIRAFHGLLADQRTNPGQYPADYNLICVGEQNLDTGAITPCIPYTIATGSAWAESNQTPPAGG